MARKSERVLQEEIMQENLAEINAATGKELFIGHLGSGRYWLGVRKAVGHENFGSYGHMSDGEMRAYISGIHAIVCQKALDVK